VRRGNEGRGGLTFILSKILRVRLGTALGKTKVLAREPSVTAARARARARAAGARARSPEAGARARAPTPAAADAPARGHEGGSLAHEAALGHVGDPARATAIAATRLRAARGRMRFWVLAWWLATATKMRGRNQTRFMHTSTTDPEAAIAHSISCYQSTRCTRSVHSTAAFPETDE
jgi:hypothetical protein